MITIISIFLALGIGIFIGFSFDAQKMIGAQRVDIISQLEERFDYLNEENKSLKTEVNLLNNELNKYVEFSKNIAAQIIKDKLEGLNVAVIETNDDYIYTNIYEALEIAGAEVTSVTTIKDNILNDIETIKTFEAGNQTNVNDLVAEIIGKLTEAIITGEKHDLVKTLHIKELIDISGDYFSSIDYLIVAGGSSKEEIDRINTVDKKIIDISKRMNVPIIGVEKESVVYSYIGEYKESRISTVDNVDSIIGQVSLILTMEGKPGNYGVKSTAENLMPSIYNLLN